MSYNLNNQNTDEKTSIPEKSSKLKKKKTRYFETYISKVLKHLSPLNGITANGKQQLNSIICHITTQITDISVKLTQESGKKTLSEKEISNSIKHILTGELLKHCLHEADDSISKFKDESIIKTTNLSRQDRAGIIFSPSITEKFLRNFGYSKLMITKNAPIYLASILEYITVEIIRSALEITKTNKHIRITVRDMELAVRTDKELNKLFVTCNLYFIGGGVVPFIYPSLQLKKPRRKGSRTGDVALKEIKKYQKNSNCVIFSRLPLERYIRTLLLQLKPKIKISKNVFIIFQYFVEQYVVKFLSDANMIAIHSGRVKVMKSDLDLVFNFRNLDIGQNIRETIQENESKEDDGESEESEDDEEEDEDESEDESEEESDRDGS